MVVTNNECPWEGQLKEALDDWMTDTLDRHQTAVIGVVSGLVGVVVFFIILMSVLLGVVCKHTMGNTYRKNANSRAYKSLPTSEVSYGFDNLNKGSKMLSL